MNLALGDIMAIEWDSVLETGNEYVDLQQRYEDPEFLK